MTIPCRERKLYTLALVTAVCLAVIKPLPVQAAVSAYSKIEAETYHRDKSKGVSASWENGGDIESLGWIDDGDYAVYKNVTFGYGISKLTFRYSKKCHPSVTVKVILDKASGGTQIADFTISSASGTKWTDFKTLEVKFKKEVSGTHDVYLKFSSLETRQQLLHVDWFRFDPSASADLEKPPVGLVVKDSEGIQYRVMKGQDSLEVISVPTSLKLWYMKNTVSLSSSAGTVKMKVKKVASNAAKNCKKLKVVYFGENIVSVDKNAFKGCTALNTLIFEGTKATKYVQPAAFYDIRNKADIYIPKKTLNTLKKQLNANSRIKQKAFRFHLMQAVG